MGRPKKNGGTFVYGVSIDKATFERIEKLAKELSLSKSAIIRLAVRELYRQTFEPR